MSSPVEALVNREYKYGFVTDIEADTAPIGLSEDTVRLISAKKEEPEWLLEWRLKAYRRWLEMTEPTWPNVRYTPIDYQSIAYYSAPKNTKPLGSLDEVDPKLLETYEKLGIPLSEQKLLAGVAVDAIFDSVSVGTTFKATLAKSGVIFCSFGEAVHEHPELVQKYLGSVVPPPTTSSRPSTPPCSPTAPSCTSRRASSARWSCRPTSASTPPNTGQFERTLIVADEGRLGELPRRVHGAEARREPAARGGGRAGRARRCDHQVLHGAELVCR